MSWPSLQITEMESQSIHINVVTQPVHDRCMLVGRQLGYNLFESRHLQARQRRQPAARVVQFKQEGSNKLHSGRRLKTWNESAVSTAKGKLVLIIGTSTETLKAPVTVSILFGKTSKGKINDRRVLDNNNH